VSTLTHGVKQQITGDQLAIGKETGRRLGMGTNMYPSSSLLGQHKDESLAALPIDELIEKADGFAGVFPGYYFSIRFYLRFLSQLKCMLQVLHVYHVFPCNAACDIILFHDCLVSS
jgi:hypothetical protein